MEPIPSSWELPGSFATGLEVNKVNHLLRDLRYLDLSLVTSAVGTTKSRDDWPYPVLTLAPHFDTL